MQKWLVKRAPAAANAAAKDTTEARAALSDPKFAEFGAMLKDLKPTVSNRSALITAAGDKAVEAIFRVLGKPGEAQRFKDKAVVFGIAMVSVNPGWRTREGFAADISVQVEMGLQPARPATLRRYLATSSIPAGPNLLTAWLNNGLP